MRPSVAKKAIFSMAIFGVLAFARCGAAGTPITFNVGLSGHLWGNELNSSFDLEDNFRLSGFSLGLSGERWRASAGDVSANWDELSFAGRSFRGLSLGLPSGRLETTLVGGSVALDNGDGTLQLSQLYGVRAALPLGHKLRASAALLQTPGAVDGSIQSLGLGYEHKKRRVALEVAHSGGGTGWQLAASLQKRKFTTRFSLRKVDSGFSSAGNPLLATRRSGYFWDGNYKFSKALSLLATSQSYGNGAGGQSRYDSLAVRLAARHRPSLTLFWQAGSDAGSDGGNNRASDDAQSGAARLLRSSTTQSSGLQISHNLGSTFLSLDYQKLRSQYGAQAAQNTNRLSFHLVRPLGRGTMLTAYHSLDLNRSVKSESRGHATAIYLHHRVGKSGLSFNVGFDQQQSSVGYNTGNALNASFGFNVPIAAGSAVGVQYRTNLASSGSLAAPAARALYVSYTRRVRIGAAPSPVRLLSEDERKKFGKLTGRIFEDTNNNGRWDAGEHGVPDVVVALSSDVRTNTNSEGQFSFRDLAVGQHRVQLRMRTLPAELSLSGAGDTLVQVTPTGATQVDIATVRAGQAKGVVFLDANRNGKRDAGETGIADAVVRVEGSDNIGFSDEKGTFTLWSLPPRRWKLSVDATAMADNLEATGSGFVEANIPANGESTGLELGIAPRQRVRTGSFTFEK